MSHIIALALTVASWPPLMMFRAHVIIVLWGWFVTPPLKVHAPSIYVVGGLLAVLHLCLPFQKVSTKKDDDGPIAIVITGIILYGILAPSSILLFGWIWKSLQWGIA